MVWIDAHCNGYVWFGLIWYNECILCLLVRVYMVLKFFVGLQESFVA